MVIFQYILSIIIWMPIIIGLLILLINNSKLSYLALLVGFINFILSILIFKNFNPDIIDWQFIEYYPWLPNIGIYYALGIDGFSVVLIMLSAFINLLILITSLQLIHNKSRYMACFLILNGLVNGVFAATNAMLFYMFFEVMLIPLFFVIGVWGGEKRIYATLKFLLYASVGSVLFLTAIIYLYNIALSNEVPLEQSLVIKNFYLLNLTIKQQTWLFIALLIAFAIKVPMLPFHNWLPDAHVEAPTEGSIMLAAITLKVGAFAIIRFLLPITSDACVLFSKFTISLSLIAIIYASFIALSQKNLKKLIAYSSIAHMGFITLGLFVAVNLIKQKNTVQATLSISGSLIHMIAHGIIVTVLFVSAGILYKRIYSNNIENFGGVINRMPKFSKLFLLFCLANMALPGTIGFVGELLIAIAGCKINCFIAGVIGVSLILSASYMLWTYKRLMLGEPINVHVKFLTDLNFQETLVLSSSAIIIILLGIYPLPIFNIINNSTLALIKAIS